MGSVSASVSASNVGNIYANVSCSALGFNLPSKEAWGGWTQDSELSRYRTRFSYKTLVYTWDPAPSSSTSNTATITFSGLGTGVSVSKTVKVTVTCTQMKDTEREKRTKKEDNTYTEWTSAGAAQSITNNSSYSCGTASATVTIYTKPTKPSWGFSSGDSLDGLTAWKWNNCINYVKNYKQWQIQGVVSGAPAHVSEGSYVTADAYNALATWCTGLNPRVKGTDEHGENADVIAASHFTSLLNDYS